MLSNDLYIFGSTIIRADRVLYVRLHDSAFTRLDCVSIYLQTGAGGEHEVDQIILIDGDADAARAFFSVEKTQ